MTTTPEPASDVETCTGIIGTVLAGIAAASALGGLGRRLLRPPAASARS